MIQAAPRKSSFAFIREYMRNFKAIGSIAPDSAPCLFSLMRRVPFATAGVIVEFGAGSGTATREILLRKEPGTRFITFERNDRFFDLLPPAADRENFFRIKADVFDSPSVLSERGLDLKGKVDCILSTLPCSCLPFENLLQRAVLPLLERDGVFIQYLHVLSYLKRFRPEPILARHFLQVDTDGVPLNLPPALVYSCRGKRDS